MAPIHPDEGTREMSSSPQCATCDTHKRRLPTCLWFAGDHTQDI